MARDSKFLYTAEVALTEAQAKTIADSAKGQPLPATIQKLCQFFLNEHTNGGMLLRNTDLEAIEGVVGERIATAAEIVKAVMAGKGREDGQLTIKHRIDPALEDALKQTADWMGMTISDVMEELANTVASNGWAYNWQPPTDRQLNLTEEDYAVLQEMLGKKVVFGADVVAHLKSLPALEKAK